jgi:hypothetical protein
MVFSRIAFVLNASSVDRAALFLASHPGIASIDEVDAPFNAGKKVESFWIVVTLRDPASGEAFVADLVRRPSFWKGFTRIMPIEEGAEYVSMEALLIAQGDRLRAADLTFRVHAYPPTSLRNCVDRLDAAGVRLEPARATHQLSLLVIRRRDRAAEPNRPHFDHWCTTPPSALPADNMPGPADDLRIFFALVDNTLQLVEGPGQAVRPAQHICRAYAKIEEVFGFHLAAGEFELSGTRALGMI